MSNTQSLRDSFFQAVPDLALLVRSDGSVLCRLGGQELGDRLMGGKASTARTLEQMWSADVARRLRQLVRHTLKGRASLDRKYHDAGRYYEVRLRPQGIDRVLMVFRELAADDEAGDDTLEPDRTRPVASRSQLMRLLSSAASEARLRERPLAVIAVYLGGLTDIERAFDVTMAEQLVRAAADRLRAFMSKELAGETGEGSPEITCLAAIADHVLAIVIENSPTRETLRTFVQGMREALAQPFDLSERTMRITPAFGIALAPEDSMQPGELLNRARSAMHDAHCAGRAIAFHSDTLRLRALSRLDSEHELRWALEHTQFQLHYRPLYSLSDARLVAGQAEASWTHPVRGQVAADEFLALAETSEIAGEIGRWILSRALADVSRAPNVTLRAIVTLCRRHLLSDSLFRDVKHAIHAASANPQRLALRIGERMLTGSSELLPQLRDLRQAGVQVIIERFGASTIAMERIADLPVDTVSLEPMLFRNLQLDERLRKICRSVIDVAHALGWQVAAEEVSREEQRVLLREFGCDLVGGELVGAPNDLHQLSEIEPVAAI
jgi:EAL domain-containing protein (putative c-di-GMP-specific phosphodiesterase class I)/GGDEF domain-containing protein